MDTNSNKNYIAVISNINKYIMISKYIMMFKKSYQEMI